MSWALSILWALCFHQPKLCLRSESKGWKNQSVNWLLEIITKPDLQLIELNIPRLNLELCNDRILKISSKQSLNNQIRWCSSKSLKLELAGLPQRRSKLTLMKDTDADVGFTASCIKAMVSLLPLVAVFTYVYCNIMKWLHTRSGEAYICTCNFHLRLIWYFNGYRRHFQLQDIGILYTLQHLKLTFQWYY